MKREQFLISSTMGHNATKYKWNSARKEVARLMQEYVNGLNRHSTWIYCEDESQSEKQGFYFVSGVMVYKEKETGEKLSFFITKI